MEFASKRAMIQRKMRDAAPRRVPDQCRLIADTAKRHPGQAAQQRRSGIHRRAPRPSMDPGSSPG